MKFSLLENDKRKFILNFFYLFRKCVQTVLKLKLYLPRLNGTIHQALIFFKTVQAFNILIPNCWNISETHLLISIVFLIMFLTFSNFTLEINFQFRKKKKLHETWFGGEYGSPTYAIFFHFAFAVSCVFCKK